MPRCVAVAVTVAACLGGSACLAFGPPYEPAPGPAREPPPPPAIQPGHLAIRVAYPPSNGDSARAGESVVVRARDDYVLQSRDSAFVFGSVGRGDAVLTVNGQSVPVYPTGGWIAWLPLPDDTLARFDIRASVGRDTARMTLVAPIASQFAPPDHGLWVDSTSLTPTGDRWLRPGEGVELSLRAADGAQVSVRLPDGAEVPLLAQPAVDEVSWGERAFGTTPPSPTGEGGRHRQFALWWTGPLGPDPGHVLHPAPPPADDDTLWVWVQAVRGSDTVRTRWPLRLGVVEGQPPPLIVVDDDTAGTGVTDNILAGRPSPFGTYHWFFPNTTVAAVSGRWNGRLRLQLSQTSIAWVNVSDVRPLPPGMPPPGGTTRSIRLVPGDRSVTLRVPLPARIPFRVDEWQHEVRLTLYGIAANMDWIQYGGTDPFVRLIAFAQPTADEAQVKIELARPVWGYRTRWDGNDLMLEIRRPPVIDPKRPLEGRLVALDPGHPPLGATGPTGLEEPEAVLAVAKKAAALLEQYGARVVLLRDTEHPVTLAERVLAAEHADAELLVSIHANALPDGVNPFANHGTSVYYFHPRSAPLARELDRALVRHLGFRDLGMGRGDLALARPTWMPAALTEGLFMMLPEQEAVLASEEGQWRYARGVVEGIAAFLRLRAVADGSM